MAPFLASGHVGDSIIVEMAYGHTQMARRVIARVLAEKIRDGYMDERETIVFAHNGGQTIYASR